MLSNHTRSTLLAVALLISATVSYSIVMAADGSDTASSAMSGTFLIYTVDGTKHVNALVDPSVLEIGGKQFLTGKVSSGIGDIWAGNAFSGSRTFIAVDAITVMQEVKIK